MTDLSVRKIGPGKSFLGFCATYFSWRDGKAKSVLTLHIYILTIDDVTPVSVAPSQVDWLREVFPRMHFL